MDCQSRTNGEIRIETVTAAFVASGVPVGVRDLGRLLENLNNPAIARHIELAAGAAIRPLYRAASPLLLDTAVLVRRDEIVFATFEGPHIEHDLVRDAAAEAPCLLMAPPFQIQGAVSFAPGAVPAQALRFLLSGFFVVRNARVYDADGYMLGEGEQIVVNGSAVQMAAPTSRHIEAFTEKAGAARRSARSPGPEEEQEATPAPIVRAA
jgi:hypothetical protein